MISPGIYTRGMPSGYEIENLVRVFYPMANKTATDQKRACGELVYARIGKNKLAAGFRIGGECRAEWRAKPADERQAKRILARMVYDLLVQKTAFRPPWGMLTGVRPVRLLRNKQTQVGSAAAREYLVQGYDVSPEKYHLAAEVATVQRPFLQENAPDECSLYVSIPFCPTRCSYCSFVSQSIERQGALTEPYLERLDEELAQTGKIVKNLGLTLRTVYVGGGTPTALREKQLEKLLFSIGSHFDLSFVREYTVEAGRPDCTSFEKLLLLKQYGVSRVSINPQSMSDKVLSAIGRRHKAADILRCYEDALRAGHENVNMDVIAGLPEDTAETFHNTLQELLRLAPANLTVHTLTLKKGSHLSGERGSGGTNAPQMLQTAYPLLERAGYRPYYLYRQKGTPDNLENTGWAKPGMECLYNILIMEEVQSILSVGAGGVTKLVSQQGGIIKRTYNDKYPLEYLRQFPKVLQRKRGVEESYARILDTQAAR
ncbi:coproporphyrinogen dehydrogenase HemZ [Ruminococcaceae bacterium OttesenSCG-928-I18]|nr:coproporphyrinogen dehydrogenase HemZ [Ruminococcaceae bacterium OttesenSCG-928-I18]